MEKQKKVWSLYRVSGDKQLENDDIPMQRNACRGFIERQKNWVLDKEFYEKGISGFKVKMSDRDEIERIKKGAMEKKFDILLVFMYDRLGRRHEETPFVVEWFVKQGIEVWSVNEGQRTFDNHVDALTNYITFWQASGESIKTSQRVKEDLKQMNEEGKYTGGTPPYGYKLVDTGEKHPKHEKTIKTIEVDEFEAIVVKKIFDLAIDEGMGAVRIARKLNDEGYKTRSGEPWRHHYIGRILKNSIVCGYKMYNYSTTGKVIKEDIKYQPFNEKYVIISKERFDKAQEIIEARSSHIPKHRKDLPTKSNTHLLSGIVRCGYCDNRLYSDSFNKKNKLVDGTVKSRVYYRYICRHANENATNTPHDVIMFAAKKYEKDVEDAVEQAIDGLDKTSFTEGMFNKMKKVTYEKEVEIEHFMKEKRSETEELKAIQSMLIKAEMGNSKIPVETIEEMYIDKKNYLESINNKINELQNELIEFKKSISQQEEKWDEIVNWREKYHQANFNKKKMMLSNIIKSVKFKKDQVLIDLDLPINN